jgi:cytosine/adenosine deaminase-related metal-dependent hydrolase
MLLVHGNYLNSKDIVQIADSQVSVMHCPRSHEYFGHRSFPAKDFRDAGVNLCLGTDSLATMSDAGAQLELFSELQQFRQQNPDFSNEDLVGMVTINAARALGMQGQVGCLRTGSCADLIALSYDGEIRRLEEAIISHQGPVDSVMIGSEWVRKFYGGRLV